MSSTATAASARTPFSRRWLWLVAALSLALAFAQSPGKISPDTKLDLTANPLRFLARALNLWNSELPFGQAQNQAYGYLFPHGAFFLLGDTVGLPGWVTQRLWWALLITVGFWGLLRLAEALGIGSPGSRVIAAAAFALSPRVLTTIGAISSETLPMMLAPWVLLPVVLALRGTGDRVRALAARSALALALMGAVNAVATLTGCLPALIWWACHRPNRLWLRFTAWWALCAALAIAWWVVPLVMLGRISPPFLDFIESSGVTTQWTSLTEVLRGTDSWTPFVAPNATAGATLVTGTVAVLATTLVAAAGLAGLAMRTMPARGRLVTILLLGITLLAAGYAGGLGSPLAHAVQVFLDADGTPLRNVHKLEPLIRLPLVLGLAHLLGRIPLPGSVPRREWMHAFAHPENDKRVAVGMVVLVALATGTSLAWTGRLTPPGAFDAIPQYWHQTADWLDEHNTGVAARPRTGGARRTVRDAGVGFQPRRAAAGARRQPVGCARLDPADTAADHPRARLGTAPLRGRATVGWAGGYPCPARNLIRRSPQRSRPGDVAIGAAGAGAPRDRGLAGADEGRRVRRAGRPRHALGFHHRQRAAAEVPRRRDLSRSRDGAARPALRISPTPTRWPASTADPKRCCDSTSAAG